MGRIAQNTYPKTMLDNIFHPEIQHKVPSALVWSENNHLASCLSFQTGFSSQQLPSACPAVHQVSDPLWRRTNVPLVVMLACPGVEHEGWTYLFVLSRHTFPYFDVCMYHVLHFSPALIGSRLSLPLHACPVLKDAKETLSLLFSSPLHGLRPASFSVAGPRAVPF